MKRMFSCRAAAAAAILLVLSAGCTMKNQEAPALTGPSQYGTGITVTASPDAITLDGASQALVTVTAYDSNGRPLRNLSLRSEIYFGGTRVDFGSLSARNIVTDASGRATMVYTAPSSGPSNLSVDNGLTVQVAVTPVGTPDQPSGNFDNEFPRLASIRLVPPGIVIPADGLAPTFDVSPTPANDHQNITFNASKSTSNPSNPIASYTWDFGDGTGGSGPITTHSYSAPGAYRVTLTIADGFGRQASAVTVVTVNGGVVPTPLFVFSPEKPKARETVFFNASQTNPAAGRTIRTYNWDFGDGEQKTTTSPLTSHDYQNAGAYRVVLVVVDDTGTRATSAPVSVTVDPPAAPTVK